MNYGYNCVYICGWLIIIGYGIIIYFKPKKKKSYEAKPVIPERMLIGNDGRISDCDGTGNMGEYRSG